MKEKDKIKERLVSVIGVVYYFVFQAIADNIGVDLFDYPIVTVGLLVLVIIGSTKVIDQGIDLFSKNYDKEEVGENE